MDGEKSLKVPVLDEEPQAFSGCRERENQFIILYFKDETQILRAEL